MRIDKRRVQNGQLTRSECNVEDDDDDGGRRRETKNERKRRAARRPKTRLRSGDVRCRRHSPPFIRARLLSPAPPLVEAYAPRDRRLSFVTRSSCGARASANARAWRREAARARSAVASRATSGGWRFVRTRANGVCARARVLQSRPEISQPTAVACKREANVCAHARCRLSGALPPPSPLLLPVGRSVDMAALARFVESRRTGCIAKIDDDDDRRAAPRECEKKKHIASETRAHMMFASLTRQIENSKPKNNKSKNIQRASSQLFYSLGFRLGKKTF